MRVLLLSLGVLGIFGLVMADETAVVLKTELVDRLAALEQQVASLDTRLSLRNAAGAGSPSSSDASKRLEQRVNQLEQTVQILSREVAQAEQAAAQARRSADAAGRDAQRALSLAQRAR